MAEPNDQPNPDAAELATLRRVNAELLKSKRDLKARVTTLEGEAATLESRAEKAESIMRAAVVDVPMRRLAEEIAHVPSLFISELEKDYRVDVDADSGELRLLTKEDGKLVTDSKGAPVAMTHNALYTFLAGKLNEPKSDRQKVYATLMRFSGASGGAGRMAVTFPSVAAGESEKKDSPVQFGLR